MTSERVPDEKENQEIAAWRRNKAEVRHDCLSFLNQIIGYTELLQEEAQAQDQESFTADLGKIDEAARSLVGALDQLFFGAHKEGEPADEEMGNEMDLPVPAPPSSGSAEQSSWALPRVFSPSDSGEPATSTADELLVLLGNSLAGKPSQLVETTTVFPSPKLRRYTTTPPPVAPARASLLIVDDNPNNRNLLARHLFKQGFAVCTAEGGREAVETLAAHAFDLVLLDFVMPDINGLETLQILRKNSSLVDLPVIMVTGRSDTDDVARALELGANDYVTKPLDLRIVLARIKNQLALKHALEFVQDANQKLERSQARLAELLGTSVTTPDDVFIWVRRFTQELAQELDVPEVAVWLVDDQHTLKVVAARDVPQPTSDDLDELAKTGKPVSRNDHVIFPARGLAGELYGVLVVPGKPDSLARPDHQLMTVCARQVGTALELRQVREESSSSWEAFSGPPAEMVGGADVDLLQVCPKCGRCYDQLNKTCPLDGQELDVSQPLPLNIANRFRLIRQIGEGGMSTIFLAKDRRLGREVAIKVINPSQFGNERARLRLVREARALARLNHPHIVGVYDAGDLSSGSLYIVMEWLEGNDVGRLVTHSGPGTPQEVARFLRQASVALSSAHRSGVLHRDIKPENIFLVPRRDRFAVKLVDFGLAKELSTDPSVTRTGSLITRVGTVLGTPLFMSPEQAMGNSIDRRSDIYSLAAVGHFALTGKYLSSSDVFVQIMLDILEGDFPPLADSVPGLPSAVEEAFARALAKSPSDRPDDAVAWVLSFVDALDNVSPSVDGWSDAIGVPQIPLPDRRLAQPDSTGEG
jgi:DNA-binding response OmpR family regulator/tRNA A-37 threonylcarbamoyl transferase component Bud32